MNRIILMLIAIVTAIGIQAADNTETTTSKTNRRPPLFCGQNQPVGEGLGIIPGRVAWVHSLGVASWDGETGLWVEDRWNNQQMADDMITEAITTLAGEENPANAWDKIFKDFNISHGRDNKGYRKGESIAIKLNMNNALTHRDTIELNSSPFITLALVRSLVNYAKVGQKDIVVCEPSRAITDSIYYKAPTQKKWQWLGSQPWSYFCPAGEGA